MSPVPVSPAPVLPVPARALLNAIAAALLVLAAGACSSSDASNTVAPQYTTTTVAAGTPLGAAQQRVVELTVASAAAQGAALDRPCLDRVAAQLTDADAQLIIDATPKGDTPTLSPQGAALASATATCLIPLESTTTTTT